jgi:hypothetical protein
MSAVLQFAAQAKRSGAEATYTVARRELEPRELGCLLLHLRRVDPDWSLPVKERRRLAVDLVEADVPDSAVIEQTGVSRTTVWRIRRDLVARPNRPRNPAFQSGESVSNRPTLTRRSSGPILCFDASGGNADVEAIRHVLGGAP